MKKLILILLFIPTVFTGQIKEFVSDEQLLVFDDGKKYNSTKVYYQSKYSFQKHSNKKKTRKSGHVVAFNHVKTRV